MSAEQAASPVTFHGCPYDGQQLTVGNLTYELPIADPGYRSTDGSEPMLVHTYRRRGRGEPHFDWVGKYLA